jgi:hypothetical protein
MVPVRFVLSLLVEYDRLWGIVGLAILLRSLNQGRIK